MATTKTTTPKVPQDRKPKKVKEDPSLTPGWDLLRPIAEIPVWDQTPLIQLLQDAFESEEDEGKGTRSFDVNVVGTIAKAMLDFSVDPDEYTKFVSGASAMEKALNLAMAWIGQMGESMGSGS